MIIHAVQRKNTFQNIKIHLFVLIYLFYLQFQVLTIIKVPVTNTMGIKFYITGQIGNISLNFLYSIL